VRCEACGNTDDKKLGRLGPIADANPATTVCTRCWWKLARGGSVTLSFVTPPQQAFANVLLYGPPKTYKTGGAASAPGRMLFLNCDLPNAIRYAHERHNQDGRIGWVQWEGMTTLIDIARVVNGPTKDRPDVVVIDTIGELHRRLMEEASGRAVSPSLPTYQAVGVHLERFCRMLCEAPVNVVFVAHDHPTKDESNGMVERLPFMGTSSNPSPAQKLLGMVDIIGYTGVIETEDGGRSYVSQLVAGKGRQGGDRFTKLLSPTSTFRETDLAEWFEIIGAHTTSEHQSEPVATGNSKPQQKEAQPA
jgi:hypothetical protein